jgi:hypothetical protein
MVTASYSMVRSKLVSICIILAALHFFQASSPFREY